MKEDVVIVIPAYNPNEELKKLIKDLKKSNFKNVVVINDGSKVWQEINAIVIEHIKNEGKGQALKTGFSYCKKHLKNVIGIITADADGQHKIEDIDKLYYKLKQEPNSLILGTRDFSQDNVPLKNKIGNKAMCKIINRKSSYKIQDTQTGLRAIPIQYIDKIIQIHGKKFEYEMNVLRYFINKKVNIIQVPIQTIYNNKHGTSNFKPIIDTVRILISNCEK